MGAAMIAVEEYRDKVARFNCGDMTIAQMVECLTDDPVFAIYFLGPLRKPQEVGE